MWFQKYENISDNKSLVTFIYLHSCVKQQAITFDGARLIVTTKNWYWTAIVYFYKYKWSYLDTLSQV